MPEFSTADLNRIESLGDNCELGFVLRRLGYEDGMLFRWTSIQPDSLLATLRGDFADLYVFENLVAHRDKMVRDRRYGTAWHTGMVSAFSDGARKFLLDEAGLRAIHASEQQKRSHLVEKLRRKFKHPNPVFVVKCNDSVSSALVESLHYQLYRRVASQDFVLLEVREDEGRAGEVEVRDRTLLRGYVSRFASYDDAENGDDPSWHRLLTQALSHPASGRPGRVSGSAQPFADIILPFPLEHEPSLAQVVTGDLRAGLVRLRRGNEWCRLIDDDVYRLHARQIGPGATGLQWSGVHLPPCFTISFHAECAIAESKPVRATLTVRGMDGQSLERSCVLRPGQPGAIVIESDWTDPGPLIVSLCVEPLETLTAGDRAVIDVQPIVCQPGAIAQRIAA